MSHSSRRRDLAPLLQPLTSTSPPALQTSHVLAQMQQHLDRHTRAASAGISPSLRGPGAGFGAAVSGPAAGGPAAAASAAARLAGAPGPPRGLPRPILAAAQQAAGAPRQKAKWVPLPEEDDSASEAEAAAAADPEAAAAAAAQRQLSAGSAEGAEAEAVLQHMAIGPGIFDDLPQMAVPQRPPGRRGRITLYCNAESFDRKKLDEVLHASFTPGAIRVFPDCFHVAYAASTDDGVGADVFFMDYGVVCCWGLDADQETSIIRNIARHAHSQAIDADEMEIDQFEFNVDPIAKPHIQNDVVTLHRKAARDHRVKLAISYALSQSTKLSLYERRVTDLIVETKHLPEQLAETGEVRMDSEDIARLIGKVFIQRAAVNLLSSVLDKPEWFWREADSYQSLYDRICEYLEMTERLEVLNARFAVLQEMLDMLRDHSNNHHQEKLELIVIWLLIVGVLVALLELASLFHLIPGTT